MKRLGLLGIVLGMVWTGACLAAEPSLCKSMCDADKRECRAHAHTLAADHAEGFFEMPERNPMARGPRRNGFCPGRLSR